MPLFHANSDRHWPQWERAHPFLLLAIGIGLFQPGVWLIDNFLQGTGRPWTYLLVLAVEQGSKFLLFFLLVPRWGFGGILAAGVLSHALKMGVGWLIAHRTVAPVRLSLWATFVGPGLAGLVNYLLWAGVVLVLPPSTNLQTLVLMCVAAGLSYFVTFFVAGITGSLDAKALEELKSAVGMASFVGPIARAVGWCAQTGARLAPVSVKPSSLVEEATREAAELDAAAEEALRQSQEAKRAAA